MFKWLLALALFDRTYGPDLGDKYEKDSLEDNLPDPEFLIKHRQQKNESETNNHAVANRLGGKHIHPDG